jgi:hypothetical protein
MAGDWKFAVCDRDGSNSQEIYNAYERKVTLPLERLPTAECRVRLDHPLADRILFNDVFLKAYRDGTLMFIGPTLTGEENGSNDAQTIQINAVGGFWYVMNRLLGKSSSGWAYGTAGSLHSRADIMRQIITVVNSDSFTGITLGTNTASSTANAHIGPVYYSPAGQSIVEVSAALNSAEWEVAPTEPTTVPGSIKQIGLFNTTDRIGQDRANIVFEFGNNTGQVTSYNRKVSRENLLTTGYTLPPGFPTSEGVPGDQNLVTTSPDAPAIAARGLIENTIQTDLASNILRQALGDEHVLVRKNPRQLLTFTLGQNVSPRAFDSYGVGDRVRARAIYNNTIRFDAMFRVWGITATIDDAGNEAIELELAEPQ